MEQKYYLGRPVTVVGDTHPSETVTIRHENGDQESVQKHLVTDKVEEAKPAKKAEIPIKEWFKK